MKSKKIKLFLFFFMLCLTSNIFAGEKSNHDPVIVNFEPGSFEVADNEKEALLNKLNKCLPAGSLEDLISTLNSVHPKIVVFGFKRSAISVQLSAKGFRTKELADS